MLRLRARDRGPGDLAAARHDPRRFARFYDAHAERVLVFFARRVLDAETAMDLTAETFALAYEAREQFRGRTPEEEQGWLWAIARSQLSAYWRARVAERSAVRRLGLELPPMLDPEIERIEEMAGIRDLTLSLEHALRGLPATLVAAVELRIIEELSYERVAARLSITPAAARARVSRGLRALAAELHRQDEAT